MLLFKRITISSVVLLSLTACGGVSTDGNSDSGTATSVQTLEFNESDVMFAQMMIPHHEQAIEISDIALDPISEASEEVKSLATQIKNAQDPEIEQMSNFLLSWNQNLTMDASMDHSGMMDGMLSSDDVERLNQLRGVDFDQAWIESMIAHHEGAVDMAKGVLDEGTNESLRNLAKQIISAQETEIVEMRQLLNK